MMEQRILKVNRTHHARHVDVGYKQSTGVTETESTPKDKITHPMSPQPISITVRRRMSKILVDHCDKLPPKNHQQGNNNNNNNVQEYRCRLCQSQVVHTKSKMFEHFVDHHPEKYFYQRDPEDLPEEMFGIRCLNIITMEVTTLTKVDPSTPTCSFCGVKMANNHILRYHLVLEHNDKLQEKINAFQKKIAKQRMETLKRKSTNATESYDKAKILKTICSPDGADANIDGDNNIITDTDSSEIEFIPKKLFAVPAHEKISVSQPGTQPTATSASMIDYSRERMTVINDFMHMPGNVLSPETISTSTSECNVSSLQVPQWKDYRNNSSHPDSFENAQEFVKSICANHSTTVGCASKDRLKCVVCDCSYPVDKIRHHIVSEHPHKFFAHIQSDILSSDKFSLLCKEAFKLLTDTAERYNGKQLLCPSCKLIFSDMNQLRYHLVVKHYDLLEENTVIQVQNGTKTKKNYRKTADSTQRTQKPVATTTVINTRNSILLSASPKLNLQFLEREGGEIQEFANCNSGSENGDSLLDEQCNEFGPASPSPSTQTALKPSNFLTDFLANDHITAFKEEEIILPN